MAPMSLILVPLRQVPVLAPRIARRGHSTPCQYLRRPTRTHGARHRVSLAARLPGHSPQRFQVTAACTKTSVHQARHQHWIQTIDRSHNGLRRLFLLHLESPKAKAVRRTAASLETCSLMSIARSSHDGRSWSLNFDRISGVISVPQWH